MRKMEAYLCQGELHNKIPGCMMGRIEEECRVGREEENRPPDDDMGAGFGNESPHEASPDRLKSAHSIRASTSTSMSTDDIRE